MKVRFTPNDINFIPEVEADYKGMLRVVTHIMYALIAANLVLVAYLIAEKL